MKRLIAIAVVLGCVVSAGCSRDSAALEIKPGSDVTLEKKDGVTVAGRLVEVKPEHVVVETRGGIRTEVRRADISTLRTDGNLSANATPAVATDKTVGSTGTGAASDDRASDPRSDPTAPEAKTLADERTAEYRELTIPTGTVLPVELTTSVASDTSNVEDPVRGTLRRAVMVGGVQALASGTGVAGNVTSVDRAARVKGRARVAFRFTTVDPPGDAERVAMRTDTVAQLAPATKKHDAAKIGGGAAGGAIIGGILGGGGGAAKGAAIGGAAGTGVVLSTRGKEVRLGPGTPVSVRLAAPLTIRVRVNR